jgi:putative glycosyltransferase (TIGR04372 family)
LIRITKKIVIGIILLPFIILVRILSPLVLVRFGNLRNHTIGTLALHAETYLMDKEMHVIQPKSIDIFFHTKPYANVAFNKMLERKLKIYSVAELLYAVNSKVPGSKKHVAHLGTGEFDKIRNHHRAYTSTKPHFSLTHEQIKLCEKIMFDETGIEPDDKFICFCSRTSNYLRKLHESGEIRSKSDLLNDSPRDSSIYNYVDSAEALANRGYYVFRMGAVVDENMKFNNNKIFDYANTFRSELLDIYLSSKCTFFLSDTTGLHCIPFMFRRPVANANMFTYHVTNVWGGVFIPKMYWLINENRYMTISEVISSGGASLGSSDWDDYAKNMNVVYKENSSDEILDLSIEMDKRLSGEWLDNAEDIERQEIFWSHFEGFDFSFGGPIKAVIASSFLRKHENYIN